MWHTPSCIVCLIVLLEICLRRCACVTHLKDPNRFKERQITRWPKVCSKPKGHPNIWRWQAKEQWRTPWELAKGKFHDAYETKTRGSLKEIRHMSACLERGPLIGMGFVKHSKNFHCVIGGCFSTCKVACENCNALCMSGRAHPMGVANFHCSFWFGERSSFRLGNALH
jgi:hypothetical protein